MHPSHLIIVILTVISVSFGAPARADDSLEEARMHYERGLSAFALEHFSEAADEYEKAFSLRSDSALLYNAAQAHRLAGHYERALRLYQSYLRVFGKRVNNRDEVQRHIGELQRTLEVQQKAKESPPVGVQAPGATSPTRASSAHPTVAASTPRSNGATPASSEPDSTASATPPAPPTMPASSGANLSATLVQTSHPAERPLYKKRWFWVVVGGAAVALGVGVGVGVGLSGSKNPSASFGATTVQ